VAEPVCNACGQPIVSQPPRCFACKQSIAVGEIFHFQRVKGICQPLHQGCSLKHLAPRND
jgi:hypothetical protein